MTPSTSRVLTHPLAFIGGGNMARSLIGGLIKRGADPSRIRVAEPNEPLRAALAADFGVQVFTEAGEAAYGADTWLFAVKPQVMRTVCESLAPMAQAQRPLVVSIAAGITVAQMQRWLGGGVPVVRSMPNTPALLGAGVTGLHASDEVDAAGRERRRNCCSPPRARPYGSMPKRRSMPSPVSPAAARPMCSCWPKRWKRRRWRKACGPRPRARWCCRPYWARRAC